MSTLLLAVFLAVSGTPHTLVLRNGAGTIPIREIVAVRDGRVLYRDRSGVLYSIPAKDVDLDASADSKLGSATDETKPSSAKTPRARPLALTPEERERLVREFERTARPGKPPAPIETADSTTETRPATKKKTSHGEEYWRSRSLRLQASVQRATKALADAKQHEQDLTDQLLFFAGTSGDATKYSYLVKELADTRDRIPRLQKAVESAQSDLEAFMDEARRQNVLPGWLR